MSLNTKAMPETSINLTDNKNEMVLNFLSEGVCHLNLKGQVTYANPSAQRMLQFRLTDMIGKHYTEVFFAQNKDTFESENDFCPIEFVLNEGEVSHVNTDSFYKSDGNSTFMVEYMCVPVIDIGEVTGAVISFQDITERRDVEIAISKARDAALETARAKAAFLANMSHEIRTPLSGIVGTADLLLDSNLTDDQRNYAEMLKKSTDLLSHIVNDILDFSKIEAGKFEREKIDFSIQKIVCETIEFFTTLIQKKDLELKFVVDESIPNKLCGDVNSIRQILNNFVSNAIKFTESGEVLLRVSAIEINKNTAKLKLSVEDSGIGIDKESCEKLFQPFMQADSSRTRKYGGTGLGLAISKQLVEMMNGKIGVESKAGIGSTFWIECEFDIAVDKINELSETTESETVINEKESSRKIEDLNILIVEDNPTNREITVEMLKQIGSNAKTAENGLEAIKACEIEEFDMILMDCHMPEMDGFESTKMIRQKHNARNQPIIVAFTAGVTTSERERCFNSGMDDYLSKPFTKQDLAKVLDKYFKIGKVEINLDLKENIIQHSLSKIIEPKMLDNLLEIEANNQQGFIFEILDIFLEHAEEKNAEIKKAINEQNRRVIKENTHNLKGSSANVGLAELSRLFDELEKRSENADWIDISNLFDETVHLFKETRTIILESKT